jgi:hypothetical protein
LRGWRGEALPSAKDTGMSPSLRLRLCAGLSLLLGLTCLWAFLDSRQEIPAQAMQTAEGTVSWIEPVYSRGKVRELRFGLFGQPRVHAYSPGLPGNDQVLEQLRRGSRVQLSYGPAGAHDIWAFQMNGQQVLNPEQRQQSQRRAGLLFLGLAVAAVGLAAWLWRRARR